MNPFASVLRDRVPKRIRTCDDAQLQTVMPASWPDGARPTLRLINVLSLRWGDHVVPKLSR